ncbi:macro domain-containing protein [Halocatena halophila]|uniref:macro domain-containing protein n=1 Tax=Halocatena halophila TaxID=2814576 RepID=UPI002ED34982
MDWTTIQGDIAQQAADALVNAAGTSLQMGSGVAGALRRGANGPINDDAVEQGPVDLGEVAVTDAYELSAEIVIHAAAMPHYGDRSATADSVRTATKNALLTADNRDCSSIVIPVLGTGVAGLEFETGARILCTTIDEFESTSLTVVRVIAYGDDEFEKLERIAKEIRGD